MYIIKNHHGRSGKRKDSMRNSQPGNYCTSTPDKGCISLTNTSPKYLVIPISLCLAKIFAFSKIVMKTSWWSLQTKRSGTAKIYAKSVQGYYNNRTQAQRKPQSSSRKEDCYLKDTGQQTNDGKLVFLLYDKV